jgi:hypothetical protein
MIFCNLTARIILFIETIVSIGGRMSGRRATPLLSERQKSFTQHLEYGRTVQTIV